MTDLTDRQLALLMDLAALQDAGMVFAGAELVYTSRSGRNNSVQLDPVVTEKGRGAVKALASRRTILRP